MSNPFIATEQEAELNYILGNDGGFDIDRAIQDVAEELTLTLPLTAATSAAPAAAAPGVEHDEMDYYVKTFIAANSNPNQQHMNYDLLSLSRPPHTTPGAAAATTMVAMAMPDHEYVMDDYVRNSIARMVSLSPSLESNSNPPAFNSTSTYEFLSRFDNDNSNNVNHGNVNVDPLARFAPQELDDFKLDFNFDLNDDAATAMTAMTDDAVAGTGTTTPKLKRDLPSYDINDMCCSPSDVRQFQELQFRLCEDDNNDQDQKAQVTAEKKRCCVFPPPIVHPAHNRYTKRGEKPVRPMRKRKIIVPDLVFKPVTPASREKVVSVKKPAKKKPIRKQVRAVLAQRPVTLSQAAIIDPMVEIRRADEAREARRNRRLLRARDQAINAVGGGDISEIQKNAISDSNTSSGTGTASEQQDLVADFFENFDPAMFVETTFTHVHRALIETSEKVELDAAAEKAACDYALEVQFKEVNNSCPKSPLQSTTQAPFSSGTAKVTTPVFVQPAAAAVVTPKAPPKKKAKVIKAKPSTAKTTKIKTNSLKSAKNENIPNNNNNNIESMLPQGKDPESRRLRRLMRNRLSAQASRDRRKKAIDDAIRTKEAKQQEIQLLQKQVEEELQRGMFLEKAVNFARKYLGEKQFENIIAEGRGV